MQNTLTTDHTETGVTINIHWEETAWFKPLGGNHVVNSTTCIAINGGSYGL